MFDIKSVKLRSEEEIISSWIDKKQIKVSILCTSYNHEAFIADAIKGFLIQETDFAFEVIIHDDASTDATADIIREYQARYPNIIKPVFQTENQYSKGRFKPSLYIQKFARGKFMALCEGDDYWIAPDKLQKQLDLCEKDTSISFVGHSALTLSVRTSQFNSVEAWNNRNYITDLHDVLSAKKGCGQFSPTASYFIKKEIFDYLPGWYMDAPGGDEFLEYFSALYGKMINLPDVMSVYRIENTAAWNGSLSNNVDFRIKFFMKRLLVLNYFKAMIGEKEKRLVDKIISETYEGLLYDRGKQKITDGIKFFFLSVFYAKKIRLSMLKKLMIIFIPKPLKNKLKRLISIRSD